MCKIKIIDHISIAALVVLNMGNNNNKKET